MGRSWAVAQTASVGASVGALIGAPVAYSQGRIAGALVAAGFLLGAAIVSQSYVLRRLEASRRAVTAITLTAYAAVFFALQAVPAANAYLAALVVFGLIGLLIWLPSAWAGRAAQKGDGPTSEAKRKYAEAPEACQGTRGMTSSKDDVAQRR